MAGGVGHGVGRLVVRRRPPCDPRPRLARCIALFAVVLACAIYAGQPDMLVLLGVAFVVFVVVLLGLRSPLLDGSGPVLVPLRGPRPGGGSQVPPSARPCSTPGFSWPVTPCEGSTGSASRYPRGHHPSPISGF